MFQVFRKRLTQSLLTAVFIVGLTCLTGFAQDVVVEPQAIDFDSVAIGYLGEIQGDRTFTITNKTDAPVTIPYIYGDPWDCFRYFSVIKPEAAIARNVIRDIYCAVGTYREDYGEDPIRLETLLDLGYLNIDPQVSEQWSFLWEDRNPIFNIFAVSTDQMPEGADHIIVFSMETGDFGGYGRFEEITLPARESRSFVVTFQPEIVGEIQAEMQFYWNNWENRISIPLRGVGYVPETLEVSTNRLSFGSVSLTGRGRMEITISNPSRLFMEYNFDFSDSDWENNRFGSFCIHGETTDDVHTAILDIYDAALRYRNDRGQDASSVEELEEEEYVNLSEAVKRKWCFTLIGANPIAQIEAISTAELQRGAGHVVLYDVQTNNFTGFGEHMGTLLGPGRKGRYIVEFIPREVGRQDVTFTITAHNEFLLHASPAFVDSAFITLTGNGVLAAPPADNASLPQLLSLSPAYPNPFNSMTRLDYSLPAAGWVKLGLYDLSGRMVMDLVDGVEGPGRHNVTLDGAGLTAEIYVLGLRTEGATRWQKVALVR